MIHNQTWLLSLGTFLPLAGVLVMLFIPKSDEAMVKGVAILTAAATLGVGIYTMTQFDYGKAGQLQFFTSSSWIKPIRATYSIGLDGIVNGVGRGGKATGEFVYKNVDQLLVDGVVNGSGTTARGAGGALQPVQSGKVSLYGALLFGAAAVGALVLVNS